MKLKNKRILVTGADGFIGSHLVEALLEEGSSVRAFVYYNAFNSWGWLDSFNQKKIKKIDIFSGDIRDPNGVKKAMDGMDMVFHLAALIGIPFSYHSPKSYIDTNINGTLNILQAALELKLEKVLITSTSEVYGTAKSVPIKESHSLQGQSPYSASKIGADKIAESFLKSFGMPIVIVRPFNTYGPRQSARAVIPTIISQILSSAKEIRVGSLFPTRDLNYIADICDGFIEIAKSDKTIGEVINVCSGEEISISELTKLILRLMNSDKKIVRDSKRVRPEKSEVERLVGDNTKICSLTGWRPGHSLKEGLLETIEWFRDKKKLALYKSNIYNI